MKKILLSLPIILGGYISAYAQCEAVAGFSEDFETYTSFPGDGCWTTSMPAPYFFLNDADASDIKLNFYSLYMPNDTFFLVSPELTTIDGLHKLSFEGARGGNPGVVKVTVGTVAGATDFASFEPVGEDYDFDFSVGGPLEEVVHTTGLIPAIEGHKHVVLRIISSNTHQNLILDNLIWEGMPCTAITDLDEDFESFTSFPEHCWTASHEAPNFGIAGTSNKVVQFYSFSNPTEDFYLVTPELTAIPEDKVVSFDAIQSGIPGTITVQVGTLAAADDYASFAAEGEPVTIVASDPTHLSNAIAQVPGHKYIAFKITPSSEHQALHLDNIKFVDATTPPASVDGYAIENLDVYPNPFSGYIMVNATETIEKAEIMDISGRIVVSRSVDGAHLKLDTNELPSGFYILRLSTAYGTQSVKMIK